VLLSVILSQRHIDLQPSVPGWHGVPEKLSEAFPIDVEMVADLLEVLWFVVGPLSIFKN